MGAILGGPTPLAWAASIQVDPTSAAAGTEITVQGTAFNGGGYICSSLVSISFTDSGGTETHLGSATPNSGSFTVQEVIPSNAAIGPGAVSAVQQVYDGHFHRCVGRYNAATTFTVISGTSSQLLGNPGFENGSSNPAPWVTTARINDTSAEPPHTGSWDAWLGGTGTNHQDSLYQDVAIPSGVASATLTFWLHVDTADAGATAHDLMRLQVRNASNAVLTTLATYSNLNAAPGYAQQSFDLANYAGQTIRVFLQSREDASLQTSFVVDDVVLTTS